MGRGSPLLNTTPSGEGDTPSQRGGGHPLPTPQPPLAPTAPRLRLKDNLCFRLLLGPGSQDARTLLDAIAITVS